MQLDSYLKYNFESQAVKLQNQTKKVKESTQKMLKSLYINSASNISMIRHN